MGSKLLLTPYEKVAQLLLGALLQKSPLETFESMTFTDAPGVRRLLAARPTVAFRLRSNLVWQ